MNNRQNITTGTQWEEIVGYSRAVRVGDWVSVSGTTAVDETGAVVGVGDMGAQTRFIIQKIEKALIACGASLSDVIRTRIFVTDISQWETVGRVHGEFFGAIKPASTMVEIKALISPELLVEIEVDAIVSHKG
ncbi:MAG: RidA family protein [Anaerolineae bacterium]|nr:RidA family protein [Anaerolineae bacterium]